MIFSQCTRTMLASSQPLFCSLSWEDRSGVKEFFGAIDKRSHRRHHRDLRHGKGTVFEGSFPPPNIPPSTGATWFHIGPIGDGIDSAAARLAEANVAAAERFGSELAYGIETGAEKLGSHLKEGHVRAMGEIKWGIMFASAAYTITKIADAYLRQR